jgi:LacI family transcriptional regulator
MNIMRKSYNITQAQIAQKLHISIVTVSKALRGHPDISPETIQRVKRIADELGYTPDLIARALSSRRSNIIGVVVPEIDHTFFASVMKGIYSTAKENHFQIVLTVSFEDDQRETENLQTLIAMRVDGILISITQKTQNCDFFKIIRRRKIPLVFFDRAVPQVSYSRVVVDDRLGAANAVEYALHQGFRRIAHLAGPMHMSIAKERCAGYFNALKANNIDVKKDLIVPCSLDEEGGYRGFKELIKRNDLPDAVFAVNDPVAIGVYEAVKEAGLRIPEDIGVIGFSDDITSRYLSPPLTTVMQPAEEIGTTAVHLLLDAIQKADKHRPREVVIPTRLVIRNSCLKM